MITPWCSKSRDAILDQKKTMNTQEAIWDKRINSDLCSKTLAMIFQNNSATKSVCVLKTRGSFQFFHSLSLQNFLLVSLFWSLLS